MNACRRRLGYGQTAFPFSLPLLICLFLIGMLHASVHAAEPNNSVVSKERPDDPYQHGMDLQSKGDHEGALMWLDQAIKLSPSSTAYYSRGYSYAKLQRYQHAIEDFTKVLSLNPDDANAYYSRGLVHSRLEQHQQAIQDLTKSLSLNPQHACAYNVRGWSHLELGQNQQAVEDYSKAIDLDPDDANAFFNRGLAYLRLEQYQRAVEDFNKNLSFDPKHVSSYKNRAFAYEKLGLHDLAERDRQQATDLGTYSDAKTEPHACEQQK
jgi:tetratricopeptide (TPR) repeat protein